MAAQPSTVVACVKWVDLRPEIDHLTGSVTTSGHDGGFSDADRCAVEVAMRIAEAWDGEVAVLCVGPSAADAGLRELIAIGASRAIRVAADHTDGSTLPGEETASLLAEVVSGLGAAGSVVVCGDLSADVGSGTVPAYLAHHLGAAQALGLVAVEPRSVGRLRAIRRLDGGRREVLELDAPAVLSVEGGVAELRRASLAGVLHSQGSGVDVVHPRTLRRVDAPRLRSWRPPTRVVAAPSGAHALDRIVALTGALVDRTPPRTVVLDPAAAADTILEQLRSWGYLPER